MDTIDRTTRRWLMTLPLVAVCGCAAMRPIDGVPASHLSGDHRAPMRSGKQRINLSLLQQTPPKEHRVDAGDVLGIYIDGVLGGRQQSPPVNFPQNPNSQSSVGYPVQVRADGKISLPLVEPIDIRGLTMAEVETKIRRTYTMGDKPPLKAGRDRILVTLQRPRHYRVLVIREEAGNPSEVVGRSGRLSALNSNGKRGAGRFISLPAYKNDVLHALAETGGLPGLDAQNVIYIIRRNSRGHVTRPVMTPPAPATDTSQPVQQPSVPMAPAVQPAPAAHPAPAVQPALPQPPAPNTLVVPPAWNGGSYRSRGSSGPMIRPQNYRQSTQSPAAGGITISPGGSYRRINWQPAQSPRAGKVRNAAGSNYRSAIRQISATVDAGTDPLMQNLAAATADGGHVVRIPLRVYPGQPLPFSPEDIILEDGDVVLIESREYDVFFTGGLLGGGRYQLPRDRDIDVIEALVLVQASLNRTLPTRSIGGIASTNQDVTSSASDMIILRPIPGGGQLPIRVDLYEAVRNPRERVFIRPGDHLILQYTKCERMGAIFERHILDGLILGISSNLFFNN